jgi:nucleotide-binding universal stress UspA family protein
VFTRILVPLDGSELAEQVLPHVETLADKFGSTVMLLRATTGMLGADVVAGEPVPISDPTLVERERLEAASYLAALAERLRRSVLAVEHEWQRGLRRRSSLSAPGTAMLTSSPWPLMAGAGWSGWS